MAPWTVCQFVRASVSQSVYTRVPENDKTDWFTKKKRKKLKSCSFIGRRCRQCHPGARHQIKHGLPPGGQRSSDVLSLRGCVHSAAHTGQRPAGPSQTGGGVGGGADGGGGGGGGRASGRRGWCGGGGGYGWTVGGCWWVGVVQWLEVIL